MNFERVEQVARAVLYEGYMLYPYRPSSVKNRHRFNFGVLAPESWCEAESGSASHRMQTECLLRGTAASRLTIKVCFLHIVERRVRRYDHEGHLEDADLIWVDGKIYQTWQEAEERCFTLDGIDPAALSEMQVAVFTAPAGETIETLANRDGVRMGEIARQWQDLTARVSLTAEPCRDEILRVRLVVENLTDFDFADRAALSRHAPLGHSLVSAHAILGVEGGGQFLSLLETPAGYEDLARNSENTGAWPVLVGEDGSMVLASPIILYDHPQIAPESAGDLFDSTEIDEILSLRILTLTDQEKAEIRSSDDRARELLDRTEAIPDSEFMKLHGVLRGLRMPGEEERR